MRNRYIERFEQAQIESKEIPQFRAGDTLKVAVRITEGNKERAAKSFMETVSMDMETLKIKSIVRDSSFFKYIISKPDGYIYHAKSGSLLGRNVSDVVEHLKNPLHEDILNELINSDN